jgi:nucleoside-diphosphate kinase
MIKPDGVKRNIIGDVVNRVEKRDFVITKMKMMQISTELAEKHYAEHSEKPFFNDLVTFITSGPVVAMEVEGDNAVLAIRELMGATNPADADPGTIRGDLACKLEENVVHGSDSEESAERELGLFFS